MKNSALVVIDLQNDITKNYREIIGKVNEAIDWAAQRELWVIYIQHNNLSAGTRTFKPGTRGAELVPELKIVSDHIFTKSKSNALTSETFAAFIRKTGLPTFTLPGRTPRPASNPPALTWRKAATAFMCCRTAPPATTKRSCRRCLPIMKARAAPSWNCRRSSSERKPFGVRSHEKEERFGPAVPVSRFPSACWSASCSSGE